MNDYIILLRGVNVGGKSIVSMADIKQCLQDLGFANVATYIASGNIMVASDQPAAEVTARVQAALTKTLKLDSELNKALVLSREQLQAIVDNKPPGFGDEPQTFHSDVIFLIGINASEAMKVFDPKEGVDSIWPGDGVIYSQRLSALRTKSRLNKIVGTPAYKAMTIRSWNTTTKLLELLHNRHADEP